MRFQSRTWFLVVAFPLLAGCTCGGTWQDPTDVDLGATALVVVVNPPLNDLNSAAVAAPGTERGGLTVSLDRALTTGDNGIAVFGNADAGTYSLAVGTGSVPVTLVDRELREMAVSYSGGTAAVMADVQYGFAGMEVIELDAGMSIADVNAALNGSNRIVLVRGGSYTGNVVFNGSNVTLFGEGATGGRVTLDGNVEVNGSGNRVRGAIVTGDLLSDGSSFGLTFSRIHGTATITGSDLVLMENVFCGAANLSGGNLAVLGNRGLSPIALPPDSGC